MLKETCLASVSTRKKNRWFSNKIKFQIWIWALLPQISLPGNTIQTKESEIWASVLKVETGPAQPKADSWLAQPSNSRLKNKRKASCWYQRSATCSRRSSCWKMKTNKSRHLKLMMTLPNLWITTTWHTLQRHWWHRASRQSLGFRSLSMLARSNTILAWWTCSSHWWKNKARGATAKFSLEIHLKFNILQHRQMNR